MLTKNLNSSFDMFNEKIANSRAQSPENIVRQSVKLKQVFNTKKELQTLQSEILAESD